MKLSKDEAKSLAKYFRDMSVSLGDYRFNNWSNLSEKERSSIEDMEWTLLNYSSDLITQAVGLIIDESTVSLAGIQGATARAIKAINKIKTAKKVIAISSSVIGLGAAIVTENLAAIACAVGDVVNIVK